MLIVFKRGFGPILPGVPHEMPDPIANIHIRAGRAEAVDDAQVDEPDETSDEVLTDDAGAPADKPAKPKKPAKSKKPAK